METALESLSKSALIALLKQERISVSQREETIFRREETIAQRDEKIAYLESQVAMYRRMQFGQKRERFEAAPGQMALPFEVDVPVGEQQEETLKEQITYIRKKQSAHKGRAALPAHLPVEEVEIHPEGDLSGMVCIGSFSLFPVA